MIFLIRNAIFNSNFFYNHLSKKQYDIWIFRIMIISIRIIIIHRREKIISINNHLCDLSTHDKFVFHFFNLISNPISENVRKCNFSKNFDANKNAKSRTIYGLTNLFSTFLFEIKILLQKIGKNAYFDDFYWKIA